MISEQLFKRAASLTLLCRLNIKIGTKKAIKKELDWIIPNNKKVALKPLFEISKNSKPKKARVPNKPGKSNI